VADISQLQSTCCSGHVEPMFFMMLEHNANDQHAPADEDNAQMQFQTPVTRTLFPGSSYRSTL